MMVGSVYLAQVCPYLALMLFKWVGVNSVTLRAPACSERIVVGARGRTQGDAPTAFKRVLCKRRICIVPLIVCWRQ